MKPDARPVLVVSGLAAETRIAAGSSTIRIAAPPATLALKLSALSEPVSAVVSFGICGGIGAKLVPGSILVPDLVRTSTESFAITRELSTKIRDLLQEDGIRTSADPIVCTDAPVLTVPEKAALYESTGCVAVDTESHLVAAYAARRGLPFIVIRAVCDAADRDLPPLAIRAIGPEGKLDWRAVGTELIARPGQLFRLPGTALATAKALNSLRRVRRCLGPRLGL